MGDECDVGLGLKMSFMSNSERYGVYGNATNQMASGFGPKSTTDRVMGISGKVLFTANQWQELERQTMIYKYIRASMPIPPQLLLPLSTQSNRVSTGLRFSNGSDPEPWRCRRTDGKKWRCAKEVAPDQRYCERHAHKTRSRSRKPVETQAHNTKDNPNTVLSAANQQTKGNEWFVKNGAIPVSQMNTQFHQSMQSPSGVLKRDQIFKQAFIENQRQKPYLDAIASDAAAGERKQDFIDAWSSIGSADDCSLTLSMQSGRNATAFDHESFEMAVGMLNDDREGCGDGYKPAHQWLNQNSWTVSTPGGPLGEALCLGISGTGGTSQDEPSPHGYSNGSCEDSSDQGLGFIR
uniref:growth-regulating factor 8 isoform X1 n=1 Tax=Erigeron canadensis TaxID=72917 RepID=UPI001CB9968E|nr:growth-regulating factor 8 isoform X1 [Erigeron canadensis]